MFQAIITYPPSHKIPSVNDMYLIGKNGNRVWKYLNPTVKNFKDQLRMSIIRQGMADYFKDKKDIVIELEILIVFSNNFWTRDVSNTIKAIEDAIVETVKTDDRFNIRVASRKVLNDKDKNEHVIIVAKDYPISEYKVNWSDLM